MFGTASLFVDTALKTVAFIGGATRSQGIVASQPVVYEAPGKTGFRSTRHGSQKSRNSDSTLFDVIQRPFRRKKLVYTCHMTISAR